MEFDDLEYDHDDGRVEAHMFIHNVFSTQGQRDVLPAERMDDLYAVIREVLADLGADPEAIGGTANHVHIVASQPVDRSVDEIVVKVKSESAKWLRASFESMRDFSWQESYGSFSLSPEDLGVGAEFVRDQAEHHEIISFQDEFRALLREHDIPFDENEVWE